MSDLDRRPGDCERERDAARALVREMAAVLASARAFVHSEVCGRSGHAPLCDEMESVLGRARALLARVDGAK